MFKDNLNVEGRVDKYKDQLVENGDSQVDGIDFGYIFSLFAMLTFTIFIFSVVVSFDFEL